MFIFPITVAVEQKTHFTHHLKRQFTWKWTFCHNLLSCVIPFSIKNYITQTVQSALFHTQFFFYKNFFFKLDPRLKGIKQNDLVMLENPSSLLPVNSHNVRTGRQRQLERVCCDHRHFADVTTDTLQHSSGRLTLWKDSHSNGHFKVLHVSPARLRAVFQGIPNKNIYICHKYCTETLRGFYISTVSWLEKGLPKQLSK